MGSVYAASELTIIAYGRNGASDGLPGVRADTRQKIQQVVYLDNLVLVSLLDAKLDNDRIREPNTVWQDRAWTLQEQLLSTRCVIFGSNQMRWECMEAAYCEETEFEPFAHGDAPILTPSRALLPWERIDQSGKDAATFHADVHRYYKMLIGTYNRRELSFSSDALNAFQGILNVMSDRTGMTCLWGHPMTFFEQHLLWSAPVGHSRCCKEFPSWSWLSYKLTYAVQDTVSEFAAIRCYTTIDGSPEGSEQKVLIRPSEQRG